MRKPEPAQVGSVRPGSPAARVGIAPGDRIVTVNGRAPRDYIEYRYLTAEPEVRLTVGHHRRRPHHPHYRFHLRMVGITHDHHPVTAA